MDNALKGQIAGSLRDLAISHDSTKLASVGLDRWLRVHDTAHCTLLGKMYLKSQLAACAWLSVEDEEAGVKRQTPGDNWCVGDKRLRENER